MSEISCHRNITMVISFLVIALCGHFAAGKESVREVTSMVLIGATGDLAKKYLWSGFFDLYLQEHADMKYFRFYAAAREDQKLGAKKIREILESSLRCKDGQLCNTAAKDGFTNLTEYYSLKKDDDYKLLCDAIEDNLKQGEYETGRIFYLSVPPFAYEQIAKNINAHCRPSRLGTWLRVVLEKPFGSDLKSSRHLANALSQYFREEEMYRVDHYLGKPGVTQILKFRMQNKNQFGDLWNKDHIERVEIVLKEKDDCAGRTNFYDQYGVIRDVMQNHMTELMAMVAMETPSGQENITDIRLKKVRLLREIRSLNHRSAVLGQYRDYNQHRGEAEGTSLTPSFAAVVMSVDNARWRGVPFLFMSGKQLNERVAYVRLIFKNNEINVGKTLGRKTCGSRQLVFHIQGGEFKKPALVLSHDLPYPESTYAWIPDSGISEVFGCQAHDFHVFTPKESCAAYSVLISGIYYGHRDMFVGTEDLLASWEVWTPLLETLKTSIPRIYDGNSLDILKFSIAGTRVKFLQEGLEGTCEKGEKCTSQSRPVGKYKAVSFRGSPLVSGHSDEVIRSLASDIESYALLSLASKGVFHLALSGGSTPAPLFEELAFSRPGFPWRQTHIWIVDERCTYLESESSNFFNLQKALLQFIPVSQLNTHPMPVSLQRGLCHPEDSGAQHYEADLKRLLGNHQLDFVLLGVGRDGHTASLFPQQPSLMENEQWVTLTGSGRSSHLKERMSMTLAILNKAKSVGVLVMGEEKKDIVSQLANGQVDVFNIPITGIQTKHGSLSWYIDDKALDNIRNSN